MSIPSYKIAANMQPTMLLQHFSSPQAASKAHSASTDVVDAVMTAVPISATPSENNTSVEYECAMPISLASPISTAVLRVGPNSTFEHESNSEDSSLSDGDRTLVDSTPDIADLSSTNNSPACSDTQLSSPEYHSRRITDFDCDDDNETLIDNSKGRKYYFKASFLDEDAELSSNLMPRSASEACNGPQKILKVLVDGGMILGNLKQLLEPFIKVPKEYFKIFRMSSLTETECTRLTEQLSTFK